MDEIQKEIPYHIRTLSNVLKAMDRVQLTDEEKQAYNRIRNRINYYENKLKPPYQLPSVQPSVQPEPSEPSEPSVQPSVQPKQKKAKLKSVRPSKSQPEPSEPSVQPSVRPSKKKPRKGKPQSKIEKPIVPIDISPKIQFIRKPIK